MATASTNQFPKVIMEEVATDGSATASPAADHRALFLGEDGQLHVKDSAGAVTDIGGAVSDILDLPTAETDDTLVLAPDGVGGVEFRAESGGGGGDLVEIAQTILGSDAANITITGLSGAYKDLVIVVLSRTDQSNDDSVLWLRVGSGSIDSGTNYGTFRVVTGSGTASTGTVSGNTIIEAGLNTGANSTAGAFASTTIEIIDYASTSKFRTILCRSVLFGAASFYYQHGMGAWRNAANAIDQVQVLPASGNLKTGSQMTIYGRG